MCVRIVLDFGMVNGRLLIATAILCTDGIRCSAYISRVDTRRCRRLLVVVVVDDRLIRMIFLAIAIVPSAALIGKLSLIVGCN